VPNRRTALLPLAVAVLGLGACSFDLGSAEPVEEPEATTSAAPESEAPEQESSAPAPDGTGLEVEAERLAEAAADALEPQLGTRPDIDCGELNLTVFEGRRTYCDLNDTDGSVYEVTLTVTEIDGTDFYFDIAVAETPRS
jgi:hypothetical protein